MWSSNWDLLLWEFRARLEQLTKTSKRKTYFSPMNRSGFGSAHLLYYAAEAHPLCAKNWFQWFSFSAIRCEIHWKIINKSRWMCVCSSQFKWMSASAFIIQKWRWSSIGPSIGIKLSFNPNPTSNQYRCYGTFNFRHDTRNEHHGWQGIWCK